MTRLTFLSPHEAEIGSASACLGKLEIRGAVPDGAIPVGKGRALLVIEGDVRAERDRLTAQGHRVYDMTAALVALHVEGEALMRRLTELDLDALPAVGAVARGTTAVIERLDGERFRLFVPQELAQYLADVVADAAEGLEA